MKPARKHNDARLTQIPMLTIEEIDKHECFRDWPHDKKQRLIKFVYELSLALYHSYFNSNEEP